jgi:hypothetical protein
VGLLVLFCSSIGFCHEGIADSLEGTKSIVLSSPTGERQVIGKIIFHDSGNNKTAFQIEIGHNLKEYFIAMRPFRCLTGEKQQLCWFPVYNEPSEISPNDMVPLEQALMFFRTKPHALNIDPFNGLYYKLRWTEQGIRGTLFEVDMTPFVAPDTNPPRARPLQAQDLYNAPPGSNWLPELSIE